MLSTGISDSSDATFLTADSSENATFAGNLTVSGNLTVTGTTTQVDTVTMNAQNAVLFEGATADDHETTLTTVDPTGDRTISLPNVSGTLPVLAVASATAITSTPEELNIMDGGTSASSTTLADADRVVVNDNGTMKQVALTDFETYFESAIDTIANLEVTTELQTPLIAFTDGDDAMTIADGGGVTFAAGLTSTAAANTLGATSFSEADLTNVGTIYADQYLGDADADTGIVLPGSNVMTLHTNNAERMRITSAGNVGIGEDTPADILHLDASGGTARLRIGSGNDAYYTSKGYLGDTWYFGSGETGDVVTSTISGGGFTSSNAGGAFVWKTEDDSTLSEKMRLTSNGFVGIGTTSPGAKLEVSGKDDAGAGDLIRLIFDNSPADTGITFADINSTIKSRITMDAANTADLRVSSASQMHFYGGTSNGTGNGHLMINSSGHVGIVAAKRFYLDNASIASGDTYIDEYSANEVGITTGGSRKFALSGGNLYIAGSVNANHNFSDERLKENIVVIPNALEKVNTLRGITFTRKADGSVGTGMIAQELEVVLPEAVYEAKSIESLEDSDAVEYKGIRYDTTVGLLVEAIKELSQNLADRNQEVTDLENRIATIEQRLI